jgi:CheY-like chemotaxis protein
MNTEYLSPAGEPDQALLPNRMRHPPRILVVDDDFFLRQLEAEVLRCAGCAVDEVEDGAAAWDLLQRKNYDLLVADNNMPMVSGVELLKLIYAARLPLPVIMATGSQPALEFASDPFLQPIRMLFKPYTLAEFLGVVKEVLPEAGYAGKEFAPANLPSGGDEGRVILAHLGNGASLADRMCQVTRVATKV